MTPGAASALLAMSDCIARQGAAHWARKAYERGATQEQLAEAWAIWSQRQDAMVQTLDTTPARCRCSHGRHTGPCPVRSCGCAIFRPKETIR